MKKISNKLWGSFMAILLVFFTGCDMTDLDINTDPNNPSTASVNLLLPNIQLEASRTFAGGLNSNTMGIMGLVTAGDGFLMTPGSWNGTWNFLYAGPLKDLDELIKATDVDANNDGRSDNPHYLGIAQVLKAYYFSMMVDLFGNVPYSEAFQGNAGTIIKAPKYDDAATIYADLLSLCDKAIANFALTSPVAIGNADLIYAGNAARWTKAARTLKLRLYLQTRNVASFNSKANIQAILADSPADKLIWTAADNFEFRFSNTLNPNDRHPMWSTTYNGGSSGYSYMTHELMYNLLDREDPRRPFYIRRQTTRILDPADATDKQTIPCSQRTDCVYGYMVRNQTIINALYSNKGRPYTPADEQFLAGFFGRDRSDPSGIPADTDLRATPSVYPCGGLYDTNAVGLSNNSKGNGNGIFPMMTDWMVRFYLAEAQLAYGDLGINVPVYLETALRAQLARVNAVGLTSDPSNAVAMPSAAIETFVSRVMAGYEASGNKMNTLLREAWYCNYGNGYEIYNAFRRTGFPNNLQTPLQPQSGFPLKYPYVLDEKNLNPNTPSDNFQADKIFWAQ